MDYDVVRKRIDLIAERINQIDGEVQEIVIKKPAKPKHIEKIEQEIGQPLPASFKKVLLEFSSHFSFRWFFPENIDIPEEFSEISGGTPHWDLKLLPQLEEDRKSTIDIVFPNPEDDYDAVWHNKLAFCDVGNGDYLAFDMSVSDDAPVVYLSHDDGEGHGYKMANNFIELLENWSRIAFVGPEDWHWMPFISNTDEGIDANSEAAKRFRNWLGLKI